VKRLAPYLKAIAGTAVAALGAVLLVLDDGITTAEWIGVAVTVITAAGTIWAVPNATKQVGAPAP
jgi:threonine/homoserine efflux transporter RhtA